MILLKGQLSESLATGPSLGNNTISSDFPFDQSSLISSSMKDSRRRNLTVEKLKTDYEGLYSFSPYFTMMSYFIGGTVIQMERRVTHYFSK